MYIQSLEVVLRRYLPRSLLQHSLRCPPGQGGSAMPFVQGTITTAISFGGWSGDIGRSKNRVWSNPVVLYGSDFGDEGNSPVRGNCLQRANDEFHWILESSPSKPGSLQINQIRSSVPKAFISSSIVPTRASVEIPWQNSNRASQLSIGLIHLVLYINLLLSSS